MKYIVILAIAVAAIGLVATGLVATGYGQRAQERNNNHLQGTHTETSKAQAEYVVDQADNLNTPPLISNIAQGDLTQSEIDGLVFMREEEKLARDVYQALYEQWGARIFSNIASSEQTHMDAVLTLLQRYGIPDPAVNNYGEFTNPELQTLYTDLVAQGSTSAEAAYRVGALIEDLDIRDLENFMSKTDNEDILLVYENLQRGSRNHLRAFNQQIQRVSGSNYVPQYISQAEFDSIIASETERGPKGGRGQNYQP